MKTHALASKAATALTVYYAIWGVLVLLGSSSWEDLEEARTYVGLGDWTYAPYPLWVAAWISGAWARERAPNSWARYVPFALNVAAIGTALTLVLLVSSSA